MDVDRPSVEDRAKARLARQREESKLPLTRIIDIRKSVVSGVKVPRTVDQRRFTILLTRFVRNSVNSAPRLRTKGQFLTFGSPPTGNIS